MLICVLISRSCSHTMKICCESALSEGSGECWFFQNKKYITLRPCNRIFDDPATFFRLCRPSSCHLTTTMPPSGGKLPSRACANVAPSACWAPDRPAIRWRKPRIPWRSRRCQRALPELHLQWWCPRWIQWLGVKRWWDFFLCHKNLWRCFAKWPGRCFFAHQTKSGEWWYYIILLVS